MCVCMLWEKCQHTVEDGAVVAEGSDAADQQGQLYKASSEKQATLYNFPCYQLRRCPAQCILLCSLIHQGAEMQLMSRGN